MAPTPPSLNNSPTTADYEPQSAGGPNNSQNRVVRKRNRVPLSCAPCRNRKLKCNRSSPCENCIKRGDASSCSYAAPTSRRKTGSKSSPSGTPDDMQNRIDRLEGLVLSLMTQGNDSASPSAVNRAMSMSTSTNSQQEFTPPQGSEEHFREDDSVESETDKVAKSFGVLHFNNNKAMYISDAHWATVLTEISEVKNYFSEHKKQYEEAMRKVEASKKQSGTQYTGPAFLLGGRNTPQLSELLASLPGRDAVDKMVNRYFNDYDPAIHILHVPSWHRTYERHWADPERSSPAFLGQLFAICGLAMQSYHKNGDEPYEYRGRTLNLSANYRSLTQQCLLLADFTKPEHAVIETMVLHLHGEYSKTGEADIGLWVLMGMIVRLAMRMGLHRDGKNFEGLSPFQCEMRRRIWTFIRQADILFSYNIGLPSMIRSSDTDTQLPLNLKDDDIDEDTQVVPEPRPIGEFTQISYLIAKAELAFIFGRIAEATQGVDATPYDEIVKLDNELRDAYFRLFPELRWKPLAESQLDPATTVTMRINISLLFNKGICVLHRRYLTLRDNPRYTHSRQSCIDASMHLLRNQQILHEESQPGRRLHRSQFHISSIMTHDFILAATLLSLDLYQSVQAEAAGRSSGDTEMWGYDRKDEIIQSLEYARSIWDTLKDRYLEAYKAYSICGVMLQKIQALRAQTMARMAGYQIAAAANGNASGQTRQSEDEKPEHSAAMTLSMLNSVGSGGNGEWKEPYPLTPQSNSNSQGNSAGQTSTSLTPNFPMDAQMTGVNNAPSPFAFFNGPSSEVPANIDWSAWDKYMTDDNMQFMNGGDMFSQGFDFAASGNMPVGSQDNSMTGQQDGRIPEFDSNLFANNPAILPPGTT